MDGEEQKQRIINIDGLIQIKTGDFIDIANTKAKQFYSLLIELNRISHPSIGGDPGGGGDVSPLEFFWGGGIVPPRFLKAWKISIHIFAF